MKKLFILAIAVVISACSGGTGGGSKTDTYLGFLESGKITEFQSSAIQVRQVELINAVRAQNGLAPVRLNAQLTAAALTHARDIANQNRAWNFGSDKSSPQLRGERAGYQGIVTGELVAESYQGELQIFSLWNGKSMTRQIMANPNSRDVGIAYYMDNSGKVWWVTDFGEPGASQVERPSALAQTVVSDNGF